MSKNKQLLILVLALFLSGQVWSQDAETVISNYIAAIGGKAAWAEINSMKITGDYNSFSVSAPFTIYRTAPSHYRFDHELNKNRVSVIFNGARAWQINPMYGSDAPMWIPNADSLVVARDAAIQPIFMTYKQAGHEVEYMGSEEVDGQMANVLKVTLADSSVENWYFDQSNHLPFKMSGETYDFGRKVFLDTYYSDYNNVDNIQMPFLVEQEFDTRYRVYTLEDVEINTAIDESIYVMPAPVEAESAEKTN